MNPIILARLRLLIVTLWVGSLWTIGYLAAPTLFATLTDRVLAGSIAGSLFRVEAWLSLFCAGALIVLQVFAVRDQPLRLRLRLHQAWLALVLGMLLCTLIGYFAIQPLMAGLRSLAGPDGVMAADIKARFGMLHGLASAIYLFQSLLAALLMFRTGLVGEGVSNKNIDTKDIDSTSS